MQQRRKRTNCASAKLVAACAVALYLYVIIRLHPHTPRHYDGPQLGETGDGFDATGETDDDADAIHLVFSRIRATSMAAIELVRFLAAGHLGHDGSGGCSEKAAKIRAEFRDRPNAASASAPLDGHRRLQVPNKPGGLVHFLQHAPVDAKFVAFATRHA